MGAYIKIALYDDDRDHTVWVSTCPVTQNDLDGALRAAGDAVMRFVGNLGGDEWRSDSVSRWLRGEDVIGK